MATNRWEVQIMWADGTEERVTFVSKGQAKRIVAQKMFRGDWLEMYIHDLDSSVTVYSMTNEGSIRCVTK